MEIIIIKRLDDRVSEKQMLQRVQAPAYIIYIPMRASCSGAVIKVSGIYMCAQQH